MGLDSKVGIYLKDGNFSSNYGILNVHPSMGTQWVCFKENCSFDSYGCPPPKKILSYLKNKHRKCFFLNIRSKKKVVFVVVLFYM